MREGTLTTFENLNYVQRSDEQVGSFRNELSISSSGKGGLFENIGLAFRSFVDEFEEKKRTASRQVEAPARTLVASENVVRGQIRKSGFFSAARLVVELSTFRCVGKWECLVTEILPDKFYAFAKDIWSGLPEAVAEFPMNELSKDDLSLFFVGATFYWSIGMKRQVDESISRTSEIRFKRSSKWSARDVRKMSNENPRIFSRFLDEKAQN